VGAAFDPADLDPDRDPWFWVSLSLRERSSMPSLDRADAEGDRKAGGSKKPAGAAA
jgi:hypothetical protein